MVVAKTLARWSGLGDQVLSQATGIIGLFLSRLAPALALRGASPGFMPERTCPITKGWIPFLMGSRTP